MAIVEDGRLEEFALEVASREQLKGNIYKGIISNIEPSLQAAFIHYGAERQGFLADFRDSPGIFSAGSIESGPAQDSGSPQKRVRNFWSR